MSARRTADRRIGILGALGIATAVGVTLTVMSPAGAQEIIAAPNDPVAKKAFEVLEKHCARCHQEGKLTEREKPAKNFGNVLKLEQIASDPHYILPGNPQGSKLFKQIIDKEMPYDVIYEGASPDITADEVLALEAWIKSLGTKTASSCESHKFVTHEDVVGLIAADVEKQQRQRRKSMRYLTLTHLTNACTDPVALNVYRQGAIKLVNSLSRSSDLGGLETIDPDQSVLRINLDDLGWESKDWDTLLATYPYNTQPDSELTAIFERSTGTKMPYVRADWFAFVASRPSAGSPAGLYDKLLK